MIFQSTLPRRERLDWFEKIQPKSRNFNPRSREGSHIPWDMIALIKSIFQSTLPRRERQNHLKNDLIRIAISIHAPAKGATPMIFIPGFIQSDFNPRSREGSDESDQQTAWSVLQFQSTLPRRERLRYMPLVIHLG